MWHGQNKDFPHLGNHVHNKLSQAGGGTNGKKIEPPKKTDRQNPLKSRKILYKFCFYHFDSVWFILVLNKCIVCNPQYQSLVMLSPPSPRRKQWGFLMFSSGIRCGWGRNTSWFAARCPQRRPWFRPVSLPPPSATSPVVKPWAFMCPWRVRDNYCSHPRTRNSNRR